MTIKNHNKMQSNYKTLDIKAPIKDVDVKQGIVTGYFAAFDNVDNGKDVIRRGAFAKTLNERGISGKNLIFHLYQHETNLILGKPTVLKEDDFGLYFETKIVPTSYGKDAILLYENGVINQHSIGFRSVRETAVRDEDENIKYFEISEIKLYEGSTVTWGMNEETPFLGMKTEETRNLIAENIKKLQKALKISGLTDEKYSLFEIELLKFETLLLNMPAEKPHEEKTAVENGNDWSFLNSVKINL